MIGLPLNSPYKLGKRQFYVSHGIEFKGTVPVRHRGSAVLFGLRIVWNALFGRIMDIDCRPWRKR